VGIRLTRKLLYFDLSDVRLMDHLDPILIVHHVLVRAEVITTPMKLCGWSETEYVTWVDTHLSRDIRDLIRKCLDTYLTSLEQQGKTETCLEHPVLRTLLMDWERSED
jgi:hypothetical protein